MSHILRMPGVPERSRDLLRRLLSEELIPQEALPHLVASYREVIRAANLQNGRADAALGDRIAKAALALLDSVNEQTGADNLRIIQAAIRYFVIEDDGGGSDLHSEEGLLDDARVMNAVLRYLGRDDLMVADIPPTRGLPRPSQKSAERRR